MQTSGPAVFIPARHASWIKRAASQGQETKVTPTSFCSLMSSMDEFQAHLLPQFEVERRQRLIQRNKRGRSISARARVTRCFCAPDNSPGKRPPARLPPPMLRTPPPPPSCAETGRNPGIRCGAGALERRRGQSHAIEQNLPSAGEGRTGGHPEQRGFAANGRPRQGEKLAGPD